MRPDVAALREAIDARLRARSTFSEESYGDQPIVFSGRQLKSFVPEPIAQARALARSPEMAHHGEAYVFWRQAKLLADFEDDYDFRGHFSRYYPTYEVMNNDQLRGYFAWRTRWRRGETVPTETSFVYVCAYELLHGVGAADARAGYDELARLVADYSESDSLIRRNIGSWMDDYVVYWGLPPELLTRISHAEQDARLATLIGWEHQSDEALFDAMVHLSSYHIEMSKLYKAHPQEMRKVVCDVYRGAADHHKGLKRSLAETYFGVSVEQDYALLRNAVFADPLAREFYEYEVSPLDHIRCRRGLWSRDQYPGTAYHNKKLGKLLKTIDAVMRETLGFEPQITAPLKTQYIHKLAWEATRRLMEAREEAERRAVRIDLSKLGSIRAAADITRDRLIVEEDEPEASNLLQVTQAPTEVEPLSNRSGEWSVPQQSAPLGGLDHSLHDEDGSDPDNVGRGPVLRKGGFVQLPPSKEPVPAGQVREAQQAQYVSPAPDTIDLTDDERSLLSLLLAGGDLRAWEREHGTMASLAVDELNEKLIDAIGDVAIDAAADPPEIFEDYQDDVRELIGG